MNADVEAAWINLIAALLSIVPILLIGTALVWFLRKSGTLGRSSAARQRRKHVNDTLSVLFESRKHRVERLFLESKGPHYDALQESQKKPLRVHITAEAKVPLRVRATRWVLRPHILVAAGLALIILVTVWSKLP
jgi:hypothetical protein